MFLPALFFVLGLVCLSGLISITAKSLFIKSGRTVESQSITLTGSRFIEIDEEIAANQTDKQVAIAFTYADLVYIYLVADQDCTVETNATDATGGQTITLKANKPLVWYKDSGITNPISANVTRFYVTNTTAISSLYCAVLNDATP